MEGPGGYQFVGRTLQMWNRYKQTNNFKNPWLLNFFDQIKFYEVSEDELKKIRRDLPLGLFDVKIEEGEFSLQEYKSLLASRESEINSFQEKREAAYQQELAHWKENGLLSYESETPALGSDLEEESFDNLPETSDLVSSPVSGSLWKLLVSEGDAVEQGQVIMVLEAMKMELEVVAPRSGRIQKFLVQEAQSLSAGQALCIVDCEERDA
jgi:urea carboxylase